MNKTIKLIIGALIFLAAIYLFFLGQTWLGILAILFSFIVFFLYFRNEYILLAFFQLRKQNIEKTKLYLSKITNPQRQLFFGQVGYYHYMLGLTQGETNLVEAERNMKAAIKHGLMFGHDKAIAKLNLAAGMLRKGNKMEAKRLLKEAKADDKQNMVLSQIEMLEKEMKRVHVSSNPRQQQIQRRGRYF